MQARSRRKEEIRQGLGIGHCVTKPLLKVRLKRSRVAKTEIQKVGDSDPKRGKEGTALANPWAQKSEGGRRGG